MARVYVQWDSKRFHQKENKRPLIFQSFSCETQQWLQNRRSVAGASSVVRKKI